MQQDKVEGTACDKEDLLGSSNLNKIYYACCLNMKVNITTDFGIQNKNLFQLK